MKTIKWTFILIGFVAILMAGQNAWADGKRSNRGHAGQVYQAHNYHGGGGHHHKKPHNGHAVHHYKRPPHHNHGRIYHRRPHHKPYYQGHDYRPPHHYHQHAKDTSGFLFSASILDPAFALNIITGERW